MTITVQELMDSLEAAGPDDDVKIQSEGNVYNLHSVKIDTDAGEVFLAVEEYDDDDEE